MIYGKTKRASISLILKTFNLSSMYNETKESSHTPRRRVPIGGIRRGNTNEEVLVVVASCCCRLMIDDD